MTDIEWEIILQFVRLPADLQNVVLELAAESADKA